MKVKLLENRNLPREGFFWIINDELIGYSEEVPMNNYEYKQSKTHEEMWSVLKPDNCNKHYNYYPRGRVMVDPEYNDLNNFIYYTCMIFLDPCITDKKYKDVIINYYNLNIPKMHNINWWEI